MTWGLHYWPTFLTISGLWVLIGFGIPESIALATSPATHMDNTLTFYARTELHAGVSIANTIHTMGWWVSLSAWLMFVVFVTLHVWYGQLG